MAEAAKSAARVPVVWIVLAEEVEEEVGEVVEEEPVDEVFSVEHEEADNEHSVFFALSIIAAAKALPIKKNRNTL